MTDRIAEAAAMVAGARAERRTLEVLPDACRPRDDAEGYAVQGAVHQALAGYKIGCTTPLMREPLGIDNPCGGGILEATVHHSGATLACAD
jgi:2-keto-4-pentenoate hydratase